jgi:hypothetical protein
MKAAQTKVVVDGKDRVLTPDEIVSAFTRVDGTRIVDYTVVTKGWFPRIRRIELTVEVLND